MADRPVISDKVREQLGRIPVSAITTVLSRRGLNRMFMKDVKPLRPDLRLVGQAFTLRYIPARPDLDDGAAFAKPDSVQRQAIETCPEGYVLVIDARGDASIACAGDALTYRMKMLGCAGIVTDGGLRDVGAISALDFPTYLQAPASPPTYIGHHPVECDVPIGCGGVPVYPGDVVVGDPDGIVIIPLEMVEEVTAAALEIVIFDEFLDSRLAEGRSLWGLYPPNDETKREYEAWRVAKGV